MLTSILLSEVPNLTGENQHNRSEFHRHALGQKRPEAQKHYGQEGKDGHALEHIQ